MILANLRRDPDIGRQKGRSQLGHQFLRRIAFIAEPLAPEIPCQPGRVLGPVGQFMRQGGGMALGIPEGLEGRHLDMVAAFGVVGARPTLPDVGAGAGEEPVSLGQPFQRRQGRGLGRGGEPGGQAHRTARR